MQDLNVLVRLGKSEEAVASVLRSMPKLSKEEAYLFVLGRNLIPLQSVSIYKKKKTNLYEN